MTAHAETNLVFSTPYCLSLRNDQMIIHTREAPDQRKSIPIEDIGFVVLEDQQTSITLPLLSALSDNNVAVILCGENRMPNAMLMNLDSNRTQGEHYRMQIAASEPLKKGLWKQIVETKIRNQAALLRKLERRRRQPGGHSSENLLVRTVRCRILPFPRRFAAQQPAQLRLYDPASRRGPCDHGFRTVPSIRDLPSESLQLLSAGR